MYASAEYKRDRLLVLKAEPHCIGGCLGCTLKSTTACGRRTGPHEMGNLVGRVLVMQPEARWRRTTAPP